MAKESKQPEQNDAMRGILDPIAPSDLTAHGQSVSGGLDPMRDLNPEYLANMDYNKEIRGGNQSFNQYGDDSSPEKQGTLGGMNEKYTGEYTKNSDINYKSDITTKDLNPNFVYGLASKVYGTDHPGYISQRNDDIASALYNEGRVSKEEVQRFLEGQTGFFNSSEADRANTVESVWKRLGAIAEQNKQEEEPDLSKAEEIEKDYSGKIYGKTTAEEGEPKEGINTLADKNSVYASMEAGRIANLKALVVMNPEDIATSIINGINPQGEQAWRDLQQYYPEVAAQVNQYIKKFNTQSTANAIASGGDLPTTTDSGSAANNDIIDFANNNAGAIKSSAEIAKDIHNSLAENQTANEASETMAVIEEDMAILKNRLRNLKSEANAAFKGDVPDYLVKAYISNKTQDIQNQMKILEDRYNAAYSRYKTELANTQWEKEFQLKQEELSLKREAYALEKRSTEQGIAIDWYKAKGSTDGTNLDGDTIPVTTFSRGHLESTVDGLVELVKAGKIGKAQCAAGIQKYYLPSIGVDFGTLSKYSEKLAIRNEGKDYSPQKGDLIILSSPTHPENGHIGIVIGVNNNGDIEYLDWNGSVVDGKGTETAAVRVIKPNNARIQGYWNATKSQGGTTSGWSGGNFTDAEIARFERYLNSELDKHEVDALKNVYGVDDAGLNAIANYAVYGDQEEDTGYSWDSNDIDYSDLDSIEVPDSVYIVDDKEKGFSRKVDPDSEEGKQLAQQYRQSVAQQGGYNAGTSTSSTTTPSSNQSTNLGFDVNMRNDFEAIYSGDKSVADIAKGRGMSQKKVQQMYDNYLKAKENGYKAYGDSGRDIDPELGFDPNSEALYKEIIKLNFRVPGTQQKQILSSFGIDSTDPDAWKQVKEEAMNYHKWAKYNLVDPQVQEMARAVEYLIAQDATSWQRWLGGGSRTSWGEMDTWNSYWNFIRNNLTLNHFEEIKKNGLTFGNLTEGELKVIGNAADALVSGGRNMDSDSFRTEVNRLYNAIRETLGYNTLSNEELNKMWDIEDAQNNSDWSNFLMLDHSHKTGLFGGYNYRRYQGKDYGEGTAGYNKYGPKSTTPGVQQSTSQSSGQGKSAQDKTDDMFTF